MKISVGAVAAFALMAWAMSSPSLAAEPMLFQASTFLSPASEASALTAQEMQMVSMRREDRFAKAVSITQFDPSVLQSSVIALEMPDHKVYQFGGASQEQSSMGAPGYFRWRGRLLIPGAPRPASSSDAMGPNATDFPTSLELFFNRSVTFASGKLLLETGVVSLQTLNSRYMVLIENGLNPTSPPIDAEPPGPRRPRSPRSGPDWPPGLLSDKLKSSIASSSVAASLSPETCDQVSSCGSVTRFSCHPERDGPEMFFDNTTGALIMACGGACMRGGGLPGSKLCTACPPPEWKACNVEPAVRQQK